MRIFADTDLQYVKGVGPRLAERFYKKNLYKVSDLLTYYPRIYMVQKSVNAISSLKQGQDVCFQATIFKIRSLSLGRSHRKGYEVVLSDKTGKISGFFFHLPYRDYFSSFEPHQQVWATGKVAFYKGRLQIHHPLLETIKNKEPLETKDKIVALYTDIDGVSQAKFRKIIKTVFDNLYLEDHLPSWLRDKYHLMDLKEAFQKVHRPESEVFEKILEFQTSAQKRLIFDEFFWMELKMALKKGQIVHQKGFQLEKKYNLTKKLVKNLDFTLTGSQKKVYQDIVSDFCKTRPMHRLIQGDVGSGKTIVAFMSSLMVKENGLQTCLMVPTEVLAQQHYEKACELLKPLGVNVELLISQLKASEKKQVYEDLRVGKIDLCIGTHALLQENVEFRSLGLVIIDEQHRFGVSQRGMLLEKNQNDRKSHFLVMTATPIPRTLAMTVYADLDISVLDEKPHGRKPVITKKSFSSQRYKVIDFLKIQLKKGHQAYVIYPLIEESEKVDLRNAQCEYEKLKGTLKGYSAALLHGKMKTKEKKELMEGFRKNKTQVLVSTTVVEVGVDVPNANVMIVEHAERFGLSQLHQLRGRVGRGNKQSYCILILGHRLSKESLMRVEVMEQYSDGFKVAEYDLKLRGPGEFLGTKQSGLTGFKMANFIRDQKSIELAKKAAFEVIYKDPHFLEPQNKKLKQAFEKNVEAFVAG